MKLTTFDKSKPGIFSVHEDINSIYFGYEIKYDEKKMNYKVWITIPNFPPFCFFCFKETKYKNEISKKLDEIYTPDLPTYQTELAEKFNLKLDI